MKPKAQYTLYGIDFALWIEETLALLNARNFTQLALEHLMEEIEALGISQRKAVASFLVRLFEYLLIGLTVTGVGKRHPFRRGSRAVPLPRGQWSRLCLQTSAIWYKLRTLVPPSSTSIPGIKPL